MSDVSHQPLPDHRTTIASHLRLRGFRGLASDPRLFQAAVVATLATPVAFFYARAIGDALVSVVAVLFLANRWALRDRTWLQATHIRLAAIFWAWLVFCTVVAGVPHAITESVVVIRLFLFAAALEFWVLADAKQRRYLFYVILAAAIWTVVEVWHQDILGTDLVGNHRWNNGVLTGPFYRARAGATLQTIYFVAFLPPAMYLLDQANIYRRLAGALVLVCTILTMAVIGQRMPLLLVIFGMCLTGLIVRRSRGPIAIALLILVLAVAAAPIISPMTYQTLIVVFMDRMEHFWSTPYALLYQRAAVMVQMHPWLGLGFDGFRDNCANPHYYHLLSWLPVKDIGDPEGCNLHPHNYWLQVATSCGLTGTLLFAALCGAWLLRIGRGVFAPGAQPIHVALLVTLCMEVWPIASTTALFTIPNAGWIFLFLGWGLAEARYGPGIITSGR
jgi:O-antigen ligase